MTVIPWVSFVLMTLAFTALYMRHRAMLYSLNKMLDEAISNEFDPDSYNETELSKIECKLSRFLSISKLKKGQLKEEHGKIHTLISDISHQTRTPIANVMLYAQLLNESMELTDDTRALAVQINSGANKLNFLIQALIKASRLESGIIRVSPQRKDACEIINAAINECTPKAHEKRISITTWPIPKNVFAMLDSKWCAEALYNILDNAVKYTDEGGSIDISAEVYEMFLRIDVKDTGIGIREEDIPRIFGRFWRAKEVSEKDGVGIGLYLAREIVTACRGYIKVSSEVGKGSVFSIFLPR